MSSRTHTTMASCRSTALHTIRQSAVLAALVVAVAIMATAASADVLLDNLGADMAARQYNVLGQTYTTDPNGETRGGTSFTVSTASNYRLDSISAIVQYVSGGTSSFEFALYDNTSSGLPGNQIASAVATADPSGVLKLCSAGFNTDTILLAGNTYWAILQASTGSNIKIGVLKGTSLPGTGRYAMYGNMGAKDTSGNSLPPYWMPMWTPGIQVTGTAVPEPASAVVLLIGSVVALARRRSGRKQ